jgi:hypothetical protein
MKPQVWVDPLEDRVAVIVRVGEYDVRVIPVIVTRPIQIPVHADGTVNDSWEDVHAWRAEWQGRCATRDTPEEAARAAVKRPVVLAWDSTDRR